MKSTCPYCGSKNTAESTFDNDVCLDCKKKYNGDYEQNLPEEVKKRDQRLQIAVSLLQGHLILKAKEGYDPMGFKEKEIRNTIAGALAMAEELLNQNRDFYDSLEGEE